jgi:hypothetical protein
MIKDDIVFSPPIVYESEGVDQNGNMFYDKQITLTGTSNKNMILNNDYANNRELFYPEQLLPKPEFQDLEDILKSLFNDKIIETEQNIELDNKIKEDDNIVVDAKEKGDNSDEKYEYLIPLSEQHNPDALKEFLSPSIDNLNKPLEIIHNINGKSNINTPNELNNDIISILSNETPKNIPDILRDDFVDMDEKKRSGNFYNPRKKSPKKFL